MKEKYTGLGLIALGKRLYNCRRWINYRFLLVFYLRCSLHPHEVEELRRFLMATSLRQAIFEVNPQFFGQLTRCFFYRGFTWQERLNIITSSLSKMEQFFTQQALERLYLDDSKPLEIMDLPSLGANETKPLILDMLFRAGEVREGTMSLRIKQEDRIIYHVNFWLQPNEAGTDMYIGCHQGSKEGLEINKAMTKAYFGCRPKNLILYFTRLLAKELHCQNLYGVSDYGFYAQNHLGRRNRKLQVSYDAFWQECGGVVSPDKRFFALPLDTPRKSIEEVPTRKRAVYKKRFALLDQLAAEFHMAIKKFKN